MAPAWMLSRGRDRILGEVDAVAVEPALVCDLEEEAVAAAEVQQPPPVAGPEQPAKRRHRHLVAADAVVRVLPGQELRVAPGRIEVAKSLGPDPGMAEQEAAVGAADDVVVPTRRVVLLVDGMQKLLQPPATAQTRSGSR